MAQPELQEAPANQEGLSDLDWMRRHISKAVDQAVPDKAFEQSDDEDVTLQVCLSISRFTSLTDSFRTLITPRTFRKSQKIQRQNLYFKPLASLFAT